MPTISANGVVLDPDDVVSDAAFCVGQQVTLSVVWPSSAPTTAQTNYQWGATPSFINRIIPATGDGSTTPTNDPATMTNGVANLWWYDEGVKQVWVNVTNSFADGQTVVTYGYGWLKMFRPQVTSFHSAPPFTPVIADGYLELGTESGDGDMAFAANVKSTNFSGVVNWTQLVNRSTTADVTSTGGQYWLDNDLLYNTVGGATNAPPTNTVVNPSGILNFLDNPGVSSSLFGVSCTDSFKTYLVFLPDPAFDDSTNIWVTLGVVNWGWSATEAIGGSLSSSNVVAPSYANSYDFPQYPHTIHGTGQPK